MTMKSLGYMTRALQARDPRFAVILEKLGYGSRETKPTKKPAKGIDELRAEYREVAGRKPFHGWNAEQLREKIAAAKG